MERNLLMVAFHIPPAAIGSGHLRPLGLARHLPSYGWSPILLSANERAYHRTDTSNKDLVPENCLVYRSFALDARRHFGIRGKYPAILAQPDRWISWWPAAVWQGLRLIRRHQVAVIWSTYPIMTAHCIAYTLSRLTGLPWIADFRDPVMNTATEQGCSVLSSQQRWERRVLRHADYCVFTTPGAMDSYAEAYPQAHREGRMAVIPNGFDDEAFSAFPEPKPYTPGRPLRLIHGGILYRKGRNPVPFFVALARLKASGTVTAAELSVTLRASGSEKEYGAEIKRLGLEDMVTLAPPISHRQALIEQADADALLLFQGQEYDRQIPAKLYEYLRMGRPIFALVGEQGDTAAVLRETGGAEIVPIDDMQLIEKRLVEFIRVLREGRAPKADEKAVQQYSRRHGAIKLAELLGRAAS
ncbi:MAG: glycosyltransferase [Gammaproteobacteria bacterium]|nr:glycosyltransferase [Gammaproteobacteria bacterium]